MSQQQPKKALRRSRGNKMVGGVIAGVAEYYDLDVTVLRVVYALATIFTAFAGVLVYLVLWMIVPLEEETR